MGRSPFWDKETRNGITTKRLRGTANSKGKNRRVPQKVSQKKNKKSGGKEKGKESKKIWNRAYSIGESNYSLHSVRTGDKYARRSGV